MVKIEWSDEAKQAFRTHLRNAKLEFGESTAKRWLKVYHCALLSWKECVTLPAIFR